MTERLKSTAELKTEELCRIEANKEPPSLEDILPGYLPDGYFSKPVRAYDFDGFSKQPRKSKNKISEWR